MLAREFGYQVAARPALLQTPGAAAALRATWQARKSKTWGPGTTTLLVLCVALLVITFAATHLLIGLAVAVFFAGLGVWASSRMRKPLANAEEVLRTQPWQVWPARVVTTGDKNWPHGLHLLAPDRTVAAAFVCRMPEDVWRGMTDGRGLVWFCGDLRFLCVAAAPGGSPAWEAFPAALPAQPVGGGTGGLEDELVREAARAAVWNLLQ
ncbi:hypothetical protein [Streptomyces sp. NPDC090022]|uniref:hypothetical protein n=1 Tax=Streptomyces sp. NPDC090022 TaxID=3365920 RepID=UPI00381815FA